MNNKHILIVDDEDQILRSIAVALQLDDYQVSTAKNGLDALKLLKSPDKQIDMVVTDIQMPVMTGIQMIDELEKSKISIPILVMTGFGTKDMVIEFLQKGVKDYIDKPFAPEAIKMRIERFFEKVQKKTIEDSPDWSQAEKFFVKKINNGVCLIRLICDYNQALQEELRYMLLKLQEERIEKICFDICAITEVDITFLNAITSFAAAHKLIFPNGSLEIININKDIMILFKAVGLIEMYNFRSMKETK